MRLALTVIAIILVALLPETTPASIFEYQAGFFERLGEQAPVESIAAISKSEVTFIGDVLLARRVETLLDRYASDYVYRRLGPVSTSTAYVVANFESAAPRVHRHTPDLTFRFSTDDVHLPALRNYGVTHVSLANNHSYDAGTEGFLETMIALKAADLVPFGDQVIASSTFTEIFVGGESIVMAGLYAIDIEPNYQALATQLKNYSTSSTMVAYIHWGTEYAPRHSATQERIARELVALGFDVIIGHHPHVVQDIQIIDGVPVFYSLGNLIFDQYFSVPVQQGLMVTMVPTADALTFRLQPVTALDVQSQPRYMTEAESAEFLKVLAAKSSSALGVQLTQGTFSVSR